MRHSFRLRGRLKEMKKTVTITVIGLVLSLVFFSGAFSARGGGGFHGGHFHGGGVHYFGGPRVFIGGYFGFPYYYPYSYYPYGYYPYGYYYPGYYPYPGYPYYGYPDGQVQAYTGQEPEYYWYYCEEADAYYPYVESCPGGWTKVIPTPPPPGKEGATK